MRPSATYKILAWLITAALVAQSWLGQLATSAVAADRNAIVICTSSGFKVIVLPDGLGPPADAAIPDGEHGGQALDCAACLAQATGQAAGDGAQCIVPFVWPQDVPRAVAEASPPRSPRSVAHPSRAPPIA